MSRPYTDQRQASCALLRLAIDGAVTLRPKEGQFLGGLAFDLNPPTDKQLNWLLILLEKHGLPPMGATA
jgi:hypothetical protein